ncbi:unnamed protein product [Clonostachys rhizophaga]|uniref:Uncharacterized protein n=1 Tax=Clonostachys rhizophaga TaxID=160324 RepID=A0A9N9YQ57_9HYPO|nr:unnamed protein product [Clonostachys rhizophaga]
MDKPNTPTLGTDDAESTAFESTSSLKRSPTNSSYYDFDNVPWDGKHGRSWMHAWRAKFRQIGLTLDGVRSTISRVTTSRFDGVYPSYFGNKEELPLKTESEPISNPTENADTKGWLHHPLIPGRTATFSGGTQEPGVVRSVYAPSDPTTFDVVYHIGTEGSDNREFRLATYHPAVKQVG